VRRNRNRYAALAAVRRGDWEAVTDDTLDLLTLHHLEVLVGEMQRRKPPAWLWDRVRDEMHRAEVNAMHAEEMCR